MTVYGSKRLDQIYELINIYGLQNRSGVEIGPFDRPILDKETYPNVKYADVFTTEQLRKMAHENPKRNEDQVVEVDFVTYQAEYSVSVGQEQMEFFICSHVLEHLPNMLGALRDIGNTLKPGGNFIIAFPDRRFTFDIDRPATSFKEFKDRFERNDQKPDPRLVFEAFDLHRQVFVGKLWNGLEGGRGKKSYSTDYAREQSKKAETEYVDVHCNILSDSEFCEIIEKANAAGIIDFRIDKIIATQAPLNEFFVVLKKV